MREIGKKIVIVGVSASGKSTFAKKISAKTELPLFLMDAIMWNPGWKYIGDEKTLRELEKISLQDKWIIEGYINKEALTFIFDRADTIIYLDYPPRVAAVRYIKRWLKHRKVPRPELEGSPEEFDFKFFKLVWNKGEAISLNKFLSEIKDPHKLIKFTSVRQTEAFLQEL